MDKKIKKDFVDLIERWKLELAKFNDGKPGTVADIAEILGHSRGHLQRMLNDDYIIDSKALKTTKNAFVVWQTEKQSSHNVTRGTSDKEKHINTRNHLKETGESKKGIMVYESAPVQAGIRTVYHDEHQVPDYVLNIPQFRDCNYGTRASGDSMYPEIRNGDLIVCKELPLDARIIFGDIYVVHTKDGIETIKYIQQFVDNDNNEPWILLVPHNKAAGMGTPIPRKEIIKLFKVRAIFKAY